MCAISILANEQAAFALEAQAAAGLDDCCPARCIAMPPPAPTKRAAGGTGVAISAWEPQRFELAGKLMDASRNHGEVLLMYDSLKRKHVAAKCVPNSWICAGPEEFDLEHPDENEQPWVDILTTAQLSNCSFPYACELLGIFRDDMSTYIITELASEGDLFAYCSVPSGVRSSPGLAREVHLMPIIAEIFDCVRRLHTSSIVHGDLSLENILLTKSSAYGGLSARIIDFGMSSTSRFRSEVVGKPSYQAPEMHTDTVYDGFQADAFSLGVVLFSVLMKDYPWASTRPGKCRCFTAFQELGFRRFIAKRTIRGTKMKVSERLSEPMVHLLEGLLSIDPSKRSCLVEPMCGSTRASVWQDPLIKYLFPVWRPSVAMDLYSTSCCFESSQKVPQATRVAAACVV
mmetsp:Transcript_125119/g.361979  ORF Transcript_125119/g.361979 Transcript_125119/m.361979 type:complete len:401 (+) Transcript_125119:61-1263(+)